MQAELAYLLETLKNPNNSSSIVPLIITLFFLVLISLISIIILVSALRMLSPSLHLPRLRIPRFFSSWRDRRHGRDRITQSLIREKVLFHDMPVTDNSELERLKLENAKLRAENAKLMIRNNGLETHVQDIEREQRESHQSLTAAHFKVVELQKHSNHLERTLEEMCFEVEQLYTKTPGPFSSLGSKLESLLRDASNAMGHVLGTDEIPRVVNEQAKEIQRLKTLLVSAKDQMLELSKQIQKSQDSTTPGSEVSNKTVVK